MTADELQRKLDALNLQLQRLQEMDEARDARYERLLIDYQALGVKYEHLQRQLREFVARTNNT